MNSNAIDIYFQIMAAGTGTESLGLMVLTIFGIFTIAACIIAAVDVARQAIVERRRVRRYDNKPHRI